MTVKDLIEILKTISNQNAMVHYEYNGPDSFQYSEITIVAFNPLTNTVVLMDKM
jgi:hypothetical protein